MTNRKEFSMKRANIMWKGFGAVIILGLAISTGWAMQEGAVKETKVKAAQLPATVAEQMTAAVNTFTFGSFAPSLRSPNPLTYIHN